MTQDAVVTKLVSRHVAEVEVERGTACGGTCAVSYTHLTLPTTCQV